MPRKTLDKLVDYTASFVLAAGPAAADLIDPNGKVGETGRKIEEGYSAFANGLYKAAVTAGFKELAPLVKPVQKVLDWAVDTRQNATYRLLQDRDKKHAGDESYVPQAPEYLASISAKKDENAKKRAAILADTALKEGMKYTKVVPEPAN